MHGDMSVKIITRSREQREDEVDFEMVEDFDNQAKMSAVKFQYKDCCV